MTSSDEERASRNLCLLIEYDGTRYAGWQVQANAPSVQGSLQEAIKKMTGERPELRVAGRTDAGVHAWGQVCNFRCTSAIASWRFAPGLNSYLANDISVHRSVEVPADFDARRDARSKRYGYRIYLGPQPAAREWNRAWQLRCELDVEAMQRASRCLVGERDFSAFRSAQCDAPHARRTMFAIDFASYSRPPLGRVVEIIFHGNAFCRHMCRILAGTLVEVGRARCRVETVEEVLESRDRRRAGVTAPACGLSLLEVLYENPLWVTS